MTERRAADRTKHRTGVKDAIAWGASFIVLTAILAMLLLFFFLK
jgi:hypothetical protein